MGPSWRKLPHDPVERMAESLWPEFCRIQLPRSSSTAYQSLAGLWSLWPDEFCKREFNFIRIRTMTHDQQGIDILPSSFIQGGPSRSSASLLRFKGVTLAESHNLVTSSAKWTQLEPLKLEPWINEGRSALLVKVPCVGVGSWSFVVFPQIENYNIIIWGNDPKATAGYNSMMNFSGSCMDGLSLSLSQPEEKERKVEM